MNPSARDPAWLRALLCERCGYVLDGLDRAGSCPECGKAIAESLPERRVGTEWQQLRTFAALRKTGYAMVRRPAAVFSIMNASPKRDLWGRHWSLLVFNCWFASWVFTAAVMASMADSIVEAVMSVIFSAVIAAYGGFALFFLSCIEMLGVLFWARRRARRISIDLSIAICAHASFGWVLGAIVSAIPVAGGVLIFRVMQRSSVGDDVAGVAFGGGGLLAALIGLVCFETLVYVGMRRCRYANAADGG